MFWYTTENFTCHHCLCVWKANTIDFYNFRLVPLLQCNYYGKLSIDKNVAMCLFRLHRMLIEREQEAFCLYLFFQKLMKSLSSCWKLKYIAVLTVDEHVPLLPVKTVLHTDKSQCKNSWGAKLVITMKYGYFSDSQMQINLTKQEKILTQTGMVAWTARLTKTRDFLAACAA